MLKMIRKAILVKDALSYFVKYFTKYFAKGLTKPKGIRGN